MIITDLNWLWKIVDFACFPGIQHNFFCLLLVVLQAYFLCKHTEMDGFLLYVLMNA